MTKSDLNFPEGCNSKSNRKSIYTNYTFMIYTDSYMHKAVVQDSVKVAKKTNFQPFCRTEITANDESTKFESPMSFSR